MGQIQRRYPRIPLDQPGEMEIRVRSAPGVAGRPMKLPVMIRTVSCEGMGVALRRHDLHSGVSVGQTVTMRLVVGSTNVEIPGRIVWFDPHEPQARQDLGVHLQLDIARAAMRQQWAEWVVGLIRLRAESA